MSNYYYADDSLTICESDSDSDKDGVVEELFQNFHRRRGAVFLQLPQHFQTSSSSENQPDSLELLPSFNRPSLAPNPILDHIISMARIMQLRARVQGSCLSNEMETKNKADDQEDNQHGGSFLSLFSSNMIDDRLSLLGCSMPLSSAVGMLVTHAGFCAISEHALQVLEAYLIEFISKIGRMARMMQDFHSSSASQQTLVAAAVREATPCGFRGLIRYWDDDICGFSDQLLQVESNIRSLLQDNEKVPSAVLHQVIPGDTSVYESSDRLFSFREPAFV
eukprot:gene395-3741_t